MVKEQLQSVEQYVAKKNSNVETRYQCAEAILTKKSAMRRDIISIQENWPVETPEMVNATADPNQKYCEPIDRQKFPGFILSRTVCAHQEGKAAGARDARAASYPDVVIPS
jgi:hypothetical protein